MAHIHKKMKKGRPYYYIREIRRVNGQPKVISQIYLGSAERIAKTYEQRSQCERPVKVRVEALGALLVAHELEKEFNTIGIVDSIVPRARNEKGPSIGEYFFYAWANRMIDPKSKHALEHWYKATAVQHVRPISLEELTSMRYWQKWDRVSSEDVDKIGQAFFEKVWASQQLPPECVLFDTTNIFSYLSSVTDSDLCQRGRNKDSKHHLRQVGLGLLVDRKTEVPLFYKIYPGNQHDSKLFHRVIDEMFGVLCCFNQTKQKLTVVFDKGMNSEDNIDFIDEHNRIHFITTYSPYFIEELAETSLDHFHPVDIEKNRILREEGREEDQLIAYRASAKLWGCQRTVVITYNPKSYRKQALTLSRKLDTVREQLLEFRKKYREKEPHWRSKDVVLRRYERLCERLHIGSQYYQIEFASGAELSFRKNTYEIQKSQKLFGRNVIVTDNGDWTTAQIVQTSLDRNLVERAFRTGKDGRHVALRPFFHWTDSKIRCQLLTCVISLTMSRILEQRLKTAGIVTDRDYSSSKAIIEQMHALHSVLYYLPQRRNAERTIEDPTELQAKVLKLFGLEISNGGVLRQLNA